MSAPIVNLKNYDPNWANQFEIEKNNILSVISNKIIAIEHIGSTSIIGLGAKPIIDIMVGVANLEDTDNLIKPLSRMEYEYVHKPELTERRFFRKGLFGHGTSHLHICEFNSKEWNEKLLFRNYLRNNAEAVKQYYKLKEKLAKEFKYNRQIYTLKKEPFIREIIEKAKMIY